MMKKRSTSGKFQAVFNLGKVLKVRIRALCFSDIPFPQERKASKFLLFSFPAINEIQPKNDLDFKAQRIQREKGYIYIASCLAIYLPYCETQELLSEIQDFSNDLN